MVGIMSEKDVNNPSIKVNGNGPDGNIAQATTTRVRRQAVPTSSVKAGPNWLAWTWAIPLFTLLPWWFVQLHYALPEPQGP